MILAGDVGATKTMLGLFEASGPHVSLLRQRTFLSSAYSGLAPMLQEFLNGDREIHAACFGVAGPVIGGAAEVTNLSWTVRADTLASDLRIPDVRLINDLIALGHGISSLTDKDFLVLNPGQAVPGANATIIAAGTGLGECTLYCSGTGYIPIPAEAGHADFAPYDDTSLELLAHLRQNGPVGVELVVSGMGIVNIYDFLRDRAELPESASIKERMANSDPAAVIAQAGATGECLLCARTLQIFVSAYGAEAGNLALRSLALGGIYIGGGIARKLANRLCDGSFMKAFVNKDRQAEMLSRIPVRVIMNENAPLLGAARYLTQHS